MDEFQAAYALTWELEQQVSEILESATARKRMPYRDYLDLMEAMDAYSNKRLLRDEYNKLCSDAFERDFPNMPKHEVTFP